MKVLIVDDDSVSRYIPTQTLEKKGYETFSAENGIEALEVLKKENIQIVLTDWMMPGMDGIELCKEIRKQHTSRYIYIIFITSKALIEDVIEALEAGADDFLTKPFNSLELMARVRSGERIVNLEENFNKIGLQLLQSEKMACIGQLAAGVAHEINNPTGFVSSNLKTLSDYQKDIVLYLKSVDRLLSPLNSEDRQNQDFSGMLKDLDQLKKDIDMAYILEDSEELIKDCLEGTDRIKKIIIDLKDFAHPGEVEKQLADINKGIDSTLNVISNELKYKTTVNKFFGDLPLFYCYPQQLNQVFMNIIVNAAHAIETSGNIDITTKYENHAITVKIKDNGKGIKKEHLSQIFDPFFTTKEVGKGTGLGMHVAFNIIQKHDGVLTVKSEEGKGAEFTVKLPVVFERDEA